MINKDMVKYALGVAEDLLYDTKFFGPCQSKEFMAAVRRAIEEISEARSALMEWEE